MPRATAPATPPVQRPRTAPFWRGAAGALALAAWSIAGVLGAALALVPVALERGPRGRARTALPVGSPLRLAPAVPSIPARPEAEPVPARAAGEAYPG